jgi:hypothetical protein
MGSQMKPLNGATNGQPEQVTTVPVDGETEAEVEGEEGDESEAPGTLMNNGQFLHNSH